MIRRLTTLVAGATIALAALPAMAAATAPTATTGGASGVTDTAATLAGTVNPGGETTTYVFQYGTTTGYGSQTTAKAAGAGTSSTNASDTVSGLSPSTTYHYRIVATNASGPAQGGDMTFTTGSAPQKPTVTTSAATLVTAVTAQANGTVNAHGQTTTFVVQYGKTTSYGAQTPVQAVGAGTTAQSVTAALAGLTPGTTYHFRVVASNASGTTNGSGKSFKTTGTAPAKPTVTAKGATNVTGSGATANASVNPKGLQTTYYFKYGPTTSYGKRTPTRSLAAGTTAQAVSAALTGLTSGTTYHYRVVATNALGTTTGGDRSFKTKGVAPTKPAAPGVLTANATSIGRSGARLGGVVDPNNLSTTYWFEYGLTTKYGVQTSARSAGSGRDARLVGATLTGLASGRTYHYRLVARNSKGKRVGADKTFTTVKPAKRAKVRVTAKTKPRRPTSFPAKFTTRGKLVLPGLSPARKAQACAGTVTVTAIGGKGGRRTVWSARARVRSDCAYKAKAKVRRRKSSLKGRARVIVRFSGNAVLKPRTVKSSRIRI